MIGRQPGSNGTGGRRRRPLEKLDANVAKEAARWTPEMEAKAVALRDGAWKSTDEALIAILASDHRAPGNAARAINTGIRARRSASSASRRP